MACPDRSLALSSLLIASLSVVALAPDARAATLSFAPAVTYATGGTGGDEPRSVAVGDFNGDGRPDIVHTSFYTGVRVRLNDGTGAFPTSTTYTAGSEPNAVAVGDLNGDVLLDLAVANRSGSSVSVLLGNGDGTFVAAVTFSTGALGSNPYSVAIGDLNADGKADLAVANVGTDNVAVLLNTAATGAAVPSFAAHVDFAAGDGPFSVAIGDLSGDGRPDLVSANEYNDSVSVLVNTTASGAAVPSFAAHVDYAAADGPLSVALGLLNADGNLDLAAANIFAGRNVSVLIGNGDGTLAAATNTPLPAVAGSPYAVKTGDFDGDGRLDLATANFNGPSASVLLGDGSGTFSVGGTYATGSSPYSVAAGDFNGDGKLDLVTSNFFGTIDGRPSLSVLLNTSASAPTIAKVFAPGTVAQWQPSTLTFTLVNPNPTLALTGIAFTDNLPSNLVVASPPSVTNTCGGITSATAGSSAISLTAGTLAAGATCTIGVHVSSVVAGIYNNTTGPISASETGAGTTSNTATLVVVGPPAVAKVFGAASIPLSGSTSLSFTINNPNTSTGLTGIGFTDVLPAGMVVATPNGLSGSCGGGAIAAVSGSSSVSLTGATLAASSTCALSVHVVGTSPGVKNNSVTVSSTEGGTGNTSTTSLTVATPPAVTKAFGAASIPLNGSTSLSVTISNPNAAIAFTGLAFNDIFPAGMVVAATPNLSNTCGGTPTAVAGAASVSLSAGTLAASATCSVSLDIQGISAGVKTNSAFASSTEGGTGTAASASLTVGAAPGITKAFGAASIALDGSTSLSFTITNPNTALALSNVSFTDTLPAGLVISTPNGITGSCGGGTITATAGASSLSLSGGTVVSLGSCTFAANVTGSTAGTKNNTTGPISSTESGPGGTSNTTSLVVVAPPTFAQAFGAATIPLNATTTLTFDLGNPNADTTLTGIGFTETLPTGLAVASGTVGVCGGTVSTTSPGTIALAGATLAPSGTCTLAVTVTGVVAGAQNATSGNVASVEGGLGGAANASVIVMAPPTLSKTFGSTIVPPGGTTTLIFTLANPAPNTLPITGLAFTDTFPAGMLVATPSGLAGSCDGGTITAAPGSGVVSLSGATLSAGGACTFTINVVVTGVGVVTNTTGPVASSEGGSGGSASASITVGEVSVPTLAAAGLALFGMLVALLGLAAIRGRLLG
ncbi:MAG: VCBS repeat-containing protein [Holophagales bacterium]|nr:VCBS repeat-containing protein [Holophagales bacterium]